MSDLEELKRLEFERSDFRQIDGFPKYRVNRLGEVYGPRGKMTPAVTERGYEFVGLREDGKSHPKRLNRIVLQAFVGECPDGMQACHNDGNRRNNRLSNLRWDTAKNNCADKVDHGTHHRGENSGKAKLTWPQVFRIRDRVSRGEAKKHVAIDFGVSDMTVRRIISESTWKPEWAPK